MRLREAYSLLDVGSHGASYSGAVCITPFAMQCGYRSVPHIQHRGHTQRRISYTQVG